MSNFDGTITLAVITSIATFCLIHFVIEPIKRKKEYKKERLKSLYSPLYVLVSHKIVMGNHANKINGRPTKIIFGGKNELDFTKDEYMIKFFMDKSSFASVELIDAFNDYYMKKLLNDVQDLSAERIMKLVVKEYNQLRKDLKLDYSREELKTGELKILK